MLHKYNTFQKYLNVVYISSQVNLYAFICSNFYTFDRVRAIFSFQKFAYLCMTFKTGGIMAIGKV